MLHHAPSAYEYQVKTPKTFAELKREIASSIIEEIEELEDSIYEKIENLEGNQDFIDILYRLKKTRYTLMVHYGFAVYPPYPRTESMSQGEELPDPEFEE